MKRKLSEWISVQLAKRPGRIVLGAILTFNILFFIVAAIIISRMSLTGTEGMGFFAAAFCTITMILDPGCIQFVVSDIGQANAAIVIVCIVIIIIGMITFTGAIIGYITNYISDFISTVNAGERRLKISGHVVILNWNSRASEIVNDLLYCETPQKVVVLTSSGKEVIEKEIDERLEDTIMKENEEIKRIASLKKGFFNKLFFISSHWFRKTVTVIVREGDVFSSKQLNDISLKKARMVIILGNDENNTVCKYERTVNEDQNRIDTLTIKTLMQVADITGAYDSDDDQKVIVEISDDWTAEQVDRIIRYKKSEGKNSIVPLKVNVILGQLLAQFSLMPELNMVYKELFSNRGMTFYVKEQKDHLEESEEEFISAYMKEHLHSIPLTSVSYNDKNYFCYAAEKYKYVNLQDRFDETDYSVKLNHDYWIDRKKVVILGHNSKCTDIMNGFASFCEEWGYDDPSRHILQIVVVDDEKNLEKMDYYKKYPFVVKTVSADVQEKDKIVDVIDQFRNLDEEDVSVLILSDDDVRNEDIDANALTNLVLNQDIISEKMQEIPDFDPESVDVVVEIIDPKHYDVVSSYSVNNVVISNRYISKMITQIGEKEELFNFFNDILVYDEGSAESGFDSKEIYIKKVSKFFDEIPGPCRADELIRAVFKASIDESIPKEKRYPTIVLGYVKPGGKKVLFGGNQKDFIVKLEANDKIIVFTNH